MTYTRKMLGAVAASVAVMLGMAGCATESGNATVDGEAVEMIDVRFGYIGDFNGTSLLAVAESEGFWEDHGISIETTSFTNGPLQIQALGTGDLDFGYIGPGAMWLPASGEAKVVAINTLGNADRVIAHAGIDSIEDLRGKKVAVPEGTSGDMILTLALERAGMTKQDVEFVPMDPATLVSAFSSNAVDAAGFWYPAIATIKEQVPDLVELAKNSDFSDEVSFPTAFVAGTDVVEGDEEMMTRVLGALRDAIEFRSANMEETIQLTADFLAIDADQVAADAGNVEVLSLEELDAMTADGTIERWLSGMNDYFVGAGKLTDPLDPSEYYTGDLFLSAGE
ncbi:NitT/TauT family transport system substrate-binding protein [Marisediminicola sp. UYEF4]|uniref:aliphatic sulfonate ABC transporter substrate-binding protein n=1 Tax=Marisediminicola sp. UYEF4 TaxID=1756384 RepID=UPI003391E33B